MKKNDDHFDFGNDNELGFSDKAGSGDEFVNSPFSDISGTEFDPHKQSKMQEAYKDNQKKRNSLDAAAFADGGKAGMTEQGLKTEVLMHNVSGSSAQFDINITANNPNNSQV